MRANFKCQSAEVTATSNYMLLFTKIVYYYSIILLITILVCLEFNVLYIIDF